MTATIRLATPHDAAGVQAIYAPAVRETAISFELEPPTVGDMERRIREVMERMPWLVCEHRGKILGYAYASPIGLGRPISGPWMSPSTLMTRHGAQESDGASTVRSLRSSSCKDFIRPMPVSRCRTRRAWGCTSRSGLNPSGFTAPWAINWGPGMMSAGGSSRCKRL